ncbi:AAA family ATPase [Desulfobotulus mexicanus]|uniref:AAA family ATPase n=1 Tax=Desulfobotulus mexicanus TaxID=2586642 RepID=A0A5Q4VF95_9BACT|nr:AAA family ATPase [Desulfobotulus mexicanus]TYT74711.1 AAA family ATPase [Desulfobotulus mexicanus]
MFIKGIRLHHFLSFGDASEFLPLNDLNIIIGPNGSGKSNLLEAIDLLRNTPDQLMKIIREGGGVGEWLWRGAGVKATASIDFEIVNPNSSCNFRHLLSFTAVNQRFEIVDEKIERIPLSENGQDSLPYYSFNSGRPLLNVKGELRTLQADNISIEKSILSQRKDPDQYPELTSLAENYSRIRLYREWQFGRHMISRMPQKTDLPNDILEQDSSNLGLVLNRLRREPAVKHRFLEALQALYEGIEDYDVQIEGGTVQVFLQENGHAIPASRLSDGTLRYLSLLAILCHPSPPPLICIEEPELGLHPDILPVLAELLKEASTRCQVIVTTHSDVLVDAMHDQPESLLVCEKSEKGTLLRRLCPEDLAPWLEKYRLGVLWTRGEIGGTRW